MKALIVLIIIAGFSSAQAQLDEASRNLLIEKLQKVNQNIAPNDSSKVAITLRLADLYSERARLESMKELESGCVQCTAGNADRKKALSAYLEVLNRVPLDSKGKVYIQVGHLYELNGQNPQAIEFYQKVISDNTLPAQLRADASLSLGELAFKRNSYAEAIRYYESVIENPMANSRGLAAYRTAWSHFHLGQDPKAIAQLTKILTDKSLLNKQGQSENIDPQFQEEVSHDLAIFYARAGFDESVISEVWKLSPEKARIANMIVLASEAERGGKKASSMNAWEYAYKNQSNPRERAESLSHLIGLGIETAKIETVMNYFEQYQSLVGTACPQDGSCDDLRKLIRAAVVNWNKLEKTNPSQNLMRAYQHYTAIYPNDREMIVYAAQNARLMKDFAKSFDLYTQASIGLSGKDLENTLLTLIEIGEEAKSDDSLLKAQNLYLEKTPLKTKYFEVQYQKAHRLYEQNKLDEAKSELKSLAVNANGPMNLRLQAADLVMDAHAINKDNKALQADATLFADLFKDKKQDFLGIAQKAILTEVAEVSKTDLQLAWVKLGQFNESAASDGDRILYLKNRLAIAEKSNRISEGLATANRLLAMKNISAADQDLALSRKAWFSELMLDFKSALEATEKLHMKDAAQEETKALRLALFADLSGQDPVAYYQKFIKTTQDESAKIAVATELVLRSSQPVVELERQKASLQKSPEEYAHLIAQVYSSTHASQLIQSIKNDSKLASTAYGKLLLRIDFIDQFNKLSAEVSSLQIDSANQAKLKKTIQARGKALDKVEAMATKAIEGKDWTSQLLSLDLLAKESNRFYQDLMGLPMPEGLSSEEEAQYMNLLSQQSAPYKVKSDQALSKVTEFWSNASWKNSLQQSIQASNNAKDLFKPEVNALAKIASANDQGFLSALSFDAPKPLTVNAIEIEEAKNQVRSNPMGLAEVQRLLNLEKSRKNFAMVQYLEGRVSQLNQKGNQ